MFFFINLKLCDMKKFLLFFLCVVSCFFLSSCVIDEENPTDYSVRDNSQDAVLFLHSPTCGYSCAAKNYIDKTYPNARIRYIDVDLEGNLYFLKAARQDYGVGNSDGFIQTPVICFGDRFIEGWDYNKAEALDSYILPYLPAE